MIKKLFAVLCAVCLLSSLSFAGEQISGADKQDAKERKARMTEFKEDRAEYLKALESLVEKYNKASDKDKESVKNEIKALISQETDRELVQKKAMLAEQRERIEKFEAQIAKIESNKEAYIDKKVNKAINPKQPKDKKDKKSPAK
ncbi:MAG: hypothetical protein FWF00_03095 [Endomicrobia bacterium]|nr:hypothetical protein [Endomicrobiia bacterium]MCL2506662.1 hypothetical protein [Endomicrobiia bacterium]